MVLRLEDNNKKKEPNDGERLIIGQSCVWEWEKCNLVRTGWKNGCLGSVDRCTIPGSCSRCQWRSNSNGNLVVARQHLSLVNILVHLSSYYDYMVNGCPKLIMELSWRSSERHPWACHGHCLVKSWENMSIGKKIMKEVLMVIVNPKLWPVV